MASQFSLSRLCSMKAGNYAIPLRHSCRSYLGTLLLPSAMAFVSPQQKQQHQTLQIKRIRWQGHPYSREVFRPLENRLFAAGSDEGSSPSSSSAASSPPRASSVHADDDLQPFWNEVHQDEGQNLPPTLPLDEQEYHDDVHNIGIHKSDGVDNSKDYPSFIPSTEDDEYDMYFPSQNTHNNLLDFGHGIHLIDDNDNDSDTLSQIASQWILQNLNDAQVQAVTQPLRSVTRVLAGPGSGKTRILTCRIAQLLMMKPPSTQLYGSQNDDNILAVTFTKKAAAEMSLRVERLLEEIHSAQQEEIAKQRQTKMQPPMMEPPNKRYGDNAPLSVVDQLEAVGGGQSHTVSEVKTRSPAVSQQLRRVTLGTFHSACSKILRWNASYLPLLNTVQTHSSANAAMTGSRNDDALLFGAGGASQGLTQEFAIADSAEQVRVLKEIYKELGISEKNTPRIYTILNAISDCKEQFAQGKNPFEKKRGGGPLGPVMQVVARTYHLYRENLFASNHLDFDDLILLTGELLEQFPDVQERMQKRWAHVLVDEFQDTSVSQLKIVKLLATDSLFVVGDGDQSIYSWRGAGAGMMHSFGDEFENVDTIYLMENYRSTSSIVKAAQKVIRSSGEESVEAKLRKDMKPIRGAGAKPKIIACANDKEEANHIITNVKAAVDSGEYGVNHELAVIYRSNAQSRALEEACVEHNLPYIIYGSATSFYRRREIKDILCFLRWLSNGQDRGSMIRAFGTPAKGIGGATVKEFDDYCSRVLAFYDSNLTGTPKPTLLEMFLVFADESLLPEGCPSPLHELSARPRKPLIAFARQMQSIRSLAKDKPLGDVVTFIVDKLELLNHFNKISKSTIEFEERKENVKEFQRASQKYSSAGPCLGAGNTLNGGLTLSPLAEFLEDVALITEMADASKEKYTEPRFVACLMTIHASKGLEFDTVYVVGNEEGTFPTGKALDGTDKNALEEEKRLCYVAMTRAKSELTMTWRKQVPRFSPSSGLYYAKGTRSRFLDSLVSKKPHSSSNDSEKRNSMAIHQQTSATTPTPAGGRKRAGAAFGGRKHPVSERIRPRAQSTSRFPVSSTWYRQGSAGRKYSTKTGPKRGKRPYSVPAGNDSPNSTPTNPKTTYSSTSSKPKAKPKAATKAIDSTWFFPVGSEVTHKALGRGIVLPPPTSAEGGPLLPVLVKFSSGEQQLFSAQGTDISPASM